MISLEDQEKLRQRFAQDLKSRVRLDFFMQKPSTIIIPGREDCIFCEQTQTLVEELAALSNRITLTIHDFDAERGGAAELGVTRVPAIVVRGQSNRPIRYFGIPGGSAFPGLIETLIDASKRGFALNAEITKRIKRLRKDVHLQVFTAPNCGFSLATARAACRVALASYRLQVDLIEAGEYPSLMQRYGVRVTPTTIFEDEVVAPGSLDEAAILEIALQVIEGKPFTGTMKTGPSTPLDLPTPAAQKSQTRTLSSGLILPR